MCVPFDRRPLREGDHTMAFHSWLRGLRRSRPTRPVKPCPPRRLRLERFEDKTVPASFTAATVSELIADINAANQTTEADTITLAARSKFTLTTVDNATDGANGLPVIAGGEDLTIVGNGDVIERSAAKAAGTPAFRLFDVAAGATFTIQNATLQGGVATGNGLSPSNGGTSAGGAIFNQGTLTLTRVTLQNNAARGADAFNFGIGFYPATSGLGGGLYSTGSMNLTGCTVQYNLAVGGLGYPTSPGEGGGVYATGSVTLKNCVIQKNSATGALGLNGGPFGGTELVVGPPFGTPGTRGGDAFGGGLCFVGVTATISN